MKRIGFLSAVLIVASTSLAAIQTKDVEYTQGDTHCKGFVAWDDAKQGKVAGVLVIPEWWGMTQYPKTRAKQLAELGYVAFVADMYGDAKMTDDPKEAGKWAGAVKGDRSVMRARAQAGLDKLKAQANVDPERIAAIGYCFGGTTVLELGMSGAPIKGIISYHGGLDFPKIDDAKNIKGNVLLFNGADDTFVTPQQIGQVADAFSAAKLTWAFVNFPGAVHAFTNPDADRHGIPGIKYNKEADQQSWQASKEFFGRIFGSQQP